MMRKLGLTIAASAAILLAGGAAANASTVTIGAVHLDSSASAAAFSSSLETFESYTVGTAPSGTLHGSGAYAGSTITTNGKVQVNTEPTAVHQHSFPGNATKYMTIFGGDNQNSKATISLSSGAHYFGFDWGTIDTKNTVTLLDKLGNTLAAFTGADFLTASGGTDHVSGFYANFTSAIAIWKVVLGSATQNSFEIDNVNVSAVPVPAALPMFGAVLAGLFGFQARRRRNGLSA
jgi:hypothetical protein